MNRSTANSFEAWRWADAAADIGWRVVAVFRGDSGEGWAVWAEARAGLNPNLWDERMAKADAED